jgi:hypothetical protein
MSSNLTLTPAIGANITVPSDGDAEGAASVITPFQELGNRSSFFLTEMVTVNLFTNAAATTIDTTSSHWFQSVANSGGMTITLSNTATDNQRLKVVCGFATNTTNVLIKRVDTTLLATFPPTTICWVEFIRRAGVWYVLSWSSTTTVAASAVVVS